MVGSCAYGATITWPLLYGNVLRITKQCSPRCTTEYFSSSSDCTARQKMHSSALGPRMYSSRQGAQSRSSAIEAARLAVLAVLVQLVSLGGDAVSERRAVLALERLAVGRAERSKIILGADSRSSSGRIKD